MKTVMIQKGILSDLKTFIDEYNQTHKPKLKVDVAVFFISLINEVDSHYRADEKEDDYTPLYSKILKEYHSNYNKYFDFLIKYNILLKQNQNTDRGKSKSFKVTDKYTNDELTSHHMQYDKLNNKFDKKNLDRHQQKKLKSTIKERPHLMKVFNNELTIDIESAYDEIKHLNDTEPRKYNNAMVLINEFKNKSWKASFKPHNSDYRLHTNLTRSAKVLRKHILIDNENIIGCDIKTSQPYFFCVVLKAILKKDKSLLEEVRATKILNGSIIEQLFDLDIDKKEVIKFVISVLSKEVDFYDYFVTKLDVKTDENGQPYRMVSNFKKNNTGKSRSKQNKITEPQTKKLFESPRELAKEVVMEIFYSSPNSKVSEAIMFRKAHPSIHKIIKCFYDNGVKFYQLLTTIEAYVLLDVAAKQISDKYPNMPLASIHDCLVTTAKHKHLLNKEMKLLIMKATTLEVKIELEQWR